MAVRGEIPSTPEPGPVSWRVAPGVRLLKVASALVLGLVALASVVAWHDPRRALVAGAAAVGVAAFAGRDLIAPVRLAADQNGLTVIHGYAGHARLPWPAVESVRVAQHSRYGLRSTSLEIDAGESVHVFSPSDLGTPLDEVAAALNELRDAAGPLGELRAGERGGAHHHQQDQ